MSALAGRDPAYVAKVLPLLKLAMNLFGKGASVPIGGHRASGGPVLGGSAYLVGERGPEIFMPASAGRILSNGDSRAAVARGAYGGSANVSVNVYGVQDVGGFNRSRTQIARQTKRALAV